jgi:hypothetical protein
MLTPILVRGVFSLQIRARGIKCEEMGLKKPIKCILSKVAAMSAMCSTQKIHFGLKMQAGGRLQYSTVKGEEFTPSHRRYAIFMERLWFQGKVTTHSHMESRAKRKISACSVHRWLRAG